MIQPGGGGETMEPDGLAVVRVVTACQALHVRAVVRSTHVLLALVDDREAVVNKRIHSRILDELAMSVKR